MTSESAGVTDALGTARRSAGVALLVLFVIAAAARWVGLASHPLDPGEASQAITAWWAATGAAGSPAELDPPPQSALLFSLQSAAFWIGGGSDVLARLPTALAGVLLIFLPLALRSGAWSSALPLAALIAVDPFLVAGARRADGAVLAAGAAIACHLLLRRIAISAPGAAVATAARWQWSMWACAAGLLLVSGVAAWDFLPPVLMAMALHAVRPGVGGPGASRPSARHLALAGGSAALLGSTLALVHWDGAALVSTSLEAWLQSWTRGSAEAASGDGAGAVAIAGVSWVATAFRLLLAAFAVWGLLRAGRAGGSAAPAGSQSPQRWELGALGLWLLWGLLMQLRAGAALAVEVPLLLAAGLGFDRLVGAARTFSPRVRLAAPFAAVGLGVAALLAGVHSTPHGEERSALEPVRRLAGDVAQLELRPAAERPRVEVVSVRPDAVLAWYLRDSEVRWVSGATDPALDPATRVVLSRRLPSEEAPSTSGPAAARYAVTRDPAGLEVVDLR